ncbi:DNA-directed RNA polymerase subunit delta [Bacillus ectoiniformans]|uniref:DNA-directed RNA polymerase subunit delta n=1 Tax=Bacillus ectoiniformans TaxID=1494429 RepID=UPI0019595FD4|nr:DNA-directed RNA polymerase subunit delta [Bacillus ectoiniformans]
MSLKQLSKEELKEMSFIELAHEILGESKQPLTFQEILNKIQGYLEISDEEVKQRMVQFYTDLNIDGSFLTLGENRWGLRAWYPVDQIEEEAVSAVKTKAKKKKAKKAEVEDLEDEEELDFDEEDLEEEVDELEDLVDEIDGLDDDDDEDEDDDDGFDDDLVTDDDDFDLDDDEEDEDEDEDLDEK